MVARKQVASPARKATSAIKVAKAAKAAKAIKVAKTVAAKPAKRAGAVRGGSGASPTRSSPAPAAAADDVPVGVAEFAAEPVPEPAAAAGAGAGAGAVAELRKPSKPRSKPVRDSFTMPGADFALIATLKSRALSACRETKKSELLRAGLHALASMDEATLLAALGRLDPVKTGRPKKGH